MIKITYYKSPYGDLILGSFREKLCLCDWRYRKMRASVDNRIQTGLNATYIKEPSMVTEDTINQLSQYFNGNRTIFDLPLLLVGSDFQKKVWHALLQVPFGQTETYSGLSKKTGNIKALRAVASANGANALSIIVPCHRVIGKNGELTGYAGGINIKRKLLQLENALNKNQLNLF
jgi:methylated-DNA-[protein]-cysteine S-methyltransferase